MKYEDFMKEMELFANPDASVADRTEKVTQILDVYKEKMERLNELETIEQQQAKQITDLTQAHAIMYRKLGESATSTTVFEEQQKSEITLEDIERGL